MNRFISPENLNGFYGAFWIVLGGVLGLFVLACTLVGLSVVLWAIAEWVVG